MVNDKKLETIIDSPVTGYVCYLFAIYLLFIYLETLQ